VLAHTLHDRNMVKLEAARLRKWIRALESDRNNPD
jgi:hypothetical protein